MKILWALLMSAVALSAAGREVVVTIDDLPRGGDGGPTNLADLRAMTDKLLKPFREQKIPVTGFVNEGRLPGLGSEGLTRLLDLWLAAGADLGNHSYSHLDVNDEPLERCTADIIRGEPVLRAALSAHGKSLRYYRHPYLHTGPTPQIKEELARFLDGHGYRVAPVTIDNADYEFAALYNRPEFSARAQRDYVPYMESVVAFFEQRSREVVGREVPQILLIHASQLNADLMPELLAMFRRRGYSFISLDQALADSAYAQPDDYVGSNGISWIHRWAVTRKMPMRWEPDPPAWVADASAGK